MISISLRIQIIICDYVYDDIIQLVLDHHKQNENEPSSTITKLKLDELANVCDPFGSSDGDEQLNCAINR